MKQETRDIIELEKQLLHIWSEYMDCMRKPALRKYADDLQRRYFELHREYVLMKRVYEEQEEPQRRAA